MNIINILNDHKELRDKLFIRGFLLTSTPEISDEEFPFYGMWNHTEVEGFHFWTHPLTGFHFVNCNGVTAFIFGHCYNPFTMDISEEKCLERILEHYNNEDFYDYFDEITGIFTIGFIENKTIKYYVDPSGMQSCCSGVINNHFYLSSHSQLIADLCDLHISDFCKELLGYKWYGRVMGPYLPADMEPFEELKRVVPNIEYSINMSEHSITHKRFYPIKDIAVCRNEHEYDQVIREAADILKHNLELIVKKWDNPGISLSGGIDSNTTFAAANGQYDKVHTFSFLSHPEEKPDCDAAKKISERFTVKWNYYKIPEDNRGITLFDEKAEIMNHNSAYSYPLKDNALRYRLYLEENNKEPVEIKSWVSETIRGYWYKHYGRKSFPHLSPKLFRNLYKIFISNRKLAHKIDKVFETYIRDFEYDSIPSTYPPADMHYNEVTWGGWGGPNISLMKYYTEIVIAYNNRRFLDLCFKVPLERRISDQLHLDMKKYLNEELSKMNIRVVNVRETSFRAFCLNCIFVLNTILP